MFRKSFETLVIISLKKDNLPYLAVLRKKNCIGKYSNFKFQKSGNFGSNSLWVIGKSRAPNNEGRESWGGQCERGGAWGRGGKGGRKGERGKTEYGSRLRYLTATPPTWQNPHNQNNREPKASGNEWLSDWVSAQKSFFYFYENLPKFKLEWMNVRKFGKYVKTIMYRKKIRLQVENRGYFWKKNLLQTGWKFTHS